MQTECYIRGSDFKNPLIFIFYEVLSCSLVFDSFQAWCIVCINDVLGLNRYFLIQDLFAILSLFKGIWNLSIYDAKVFYNLENNGIEYNLYLRMAFFKLVNTI